MVSTLPLQSRRRFVGFGMVALPLLLAGCGGSSPPTTTSNATAATSRPATTTTLQNSGSVGVAAVANLSRLESLTNYSYTSTAGAGTATETFIGQIHSQTDFDIALGSTKTYYVNGQGYEVLGSLAPQKVTIAANYLNNQGEMAAAQTFVGLTHASGVTVVKGGACSEAGVSGTIYKEETPANGGIINIGQEACIANHGGELLSFQEGVSGSSAPASSGATYNFIVTGVGNVPTIAVP